MSTDSRPRKGGVGRPLVSILMPCFNTEQFVAEAIDSILDQTYSRWELLICDDGSTDGTKAIIDAYRDARIKTFHHGANRGYLRTCNELFTLCTGDLITFQDSDDASSPFRLERQVNAFSGDADLGICGTWTRNVTEAGQFIKIGRRALSDEEIRACVSTRSPFCGATIMIRRTAYDRVGGYRSFFNGISYQDYDWAYRVVEKFKAVNLGEALYVRRHRAGATSTEVKPIRAVGDKIVQYLLGSQREGGRRPDDLMRGDVRSVSDKVERLLRPYVEDKTLIYRQYSTEFVRNKLHWMGIRTSLEGWRREPWKVANLRAVLHCVYLAVVR